MSLQSPRARLEQAAERAELVLRSKSSNSPSGAALAECAAAIRAYFQADPWPVEPDTDALPDAEPTVMQPAPAKPLKGGRKK